MTRVPAPDWLRSWMPGVGVVADYRRSWFRFDLIAGLTVGAMLVPQTMAYAQLAGLPAEAGLYASVLPLLAYALFGSSRHLMVGPESTTSIMVATTVAPLAGGDPATYVTLAAATALIVGVLCVLGGVIRLGFVADVLSRPVLVGYLSGVGLIMIGGQLEKLSGVPVEADRFVGQVGDFVTGLDQLHTATTVVGVVSIVALVLLMWRFRNVPAVLLVVVVSSIIVAITGLDEQGVVVVGSVPSGLPDLSLPGLSWDELGSVLPAAAAIAVIAYTDNILTARSFAAKNGYQVDANQEMVALGAANLAAGVSQGFAISSSGSRTAVNDGVGGRTQMVGVVAMFLVVGTLLVLSPLLELFPQAVLAAIIIVAGARLVDVAAFVELARVRRVEFALALATLLGVLVYDLLVGVVIAVVLSLIVTLARVARPRDAELGWVPGMDGFHNIHRYDEAEPIAGLVMYRFEGPLIFLSAGYFRTRTQRILDRRAAAGAWLLLDAEAVSDIDATGVAALGDLVDALDGIGMRLVIARANGRVRGVLERTGLINRVGWDHLYPTVRTGVAAYLTRDE